AEIGGAAGLASGNKLLLILAGKPPFLIKTRKTFRQPLPARYYFPCRIMVPAMKPRIAIPVPTTSNLEYNQRSWPQYAEAVTRAGGEPVSIPLDASPRETADLINTCQGVLLPGSPADVNPQKYGHEPIPECNPADPGRENVDELLIQDAHNLYKPILAICFGVQSLNVWRGGTLVQDLAPMPVNHSAGRTVAVAHA